MVDNLILLYDANETAFQSNGLGSLNDAIKCTVTEARNSDYELDMEYPVNGRHYSDLMVRRIIYAKPNPHDGPQPFRIYSISRPISGKISVVAAHISYDLSDYVVMPFIATSYSDVFSKLNSGATMYPDAPTNPFRVGGARFHLEMPNQEFKNYETDEGWTPGAGYHVGAVIYIQNQQGARFVYECMHEITPGQFTDFTVSSGGVTYWRLVSGEDERFKVKVPTPVRSVMGDGSDGILGRFFTNGHRGEYYYDHFDVYFKSARGEDRGFEIRYGKNMTDVEKEEECDNDYTHLLPFWKKINDDGSYVEVMSGNPLYPIGNTTGRHMKIKPVDLSSEFDEAPTSSKMEQYAEKYVKDEELTGQEDITITVNFQSLHKSAEYSKYKELETIKLCDTVTVVHEGLGINDKKKVVRTTYDVIADQYTEIEIGQPKETMAAVIGTTQLITQTNEVNTGDLMASAVTTVTDGLGLTHTIYYVDTQGLGEDHIPDPTGWIEPRSDPTFEAEQIDEWITVEPVPTEENAGFPVYVRTQNKFLDGGIKLGNISLSKVFSTIKDWITDDSGGGGGSGFVSGLFNGIKTAVNSLPGTAIQDEGVTEAKIGSSAVTTNKIYTAAVTREKISNDAIHSSNFRMYPDYNASTYYDAGERVIAPTDGLVYECMEDGSGGTSWASQPAENWRYVKPGTCSERGSYLDLADGSFHTPGFAISGDAIQNQFYGYIAGWNVSTDTLSSIHTPSAAGEAGRSIRLGSLGDWQAAETSPVGAANNGVRVNNLTFLVTKTPAYTEVPIWTSGTAYKPADYVRLSNSVIVYRCILAHTASDSNKPANATYWANAAMDYARAEGAVFGIGEDGKVYATEGHIGGLSLGSPKSLSANTKYASDDVLLGLRYSDYSLTSFNTRQAMAVSPTEVYFQRGPTSFELTPNTDSNGRKSYVIGMYAGTFDGDSRTIHAGLELDCLSGTPEGVMDGNWNFYDNNGTVATLSQIVALVAKVSELETRIEALEDAVRDL